MAISRHEIRNRRVACIVRGMDREPRLRALYAAFNRRDADTALAGMTDDVDWPNGWEGGRVEGREAVRDYWRRQWAQLDSHVEPTAITERADGGSRCACIRSAATWREASSSTRKSSTSTRIAAIWSSA